MTTAQHPTSYQYPSSSNQNLNQQKNAGLTENQLKWPPGIQGKKKWPIRILSFLLFAATVAIVYIFGQDNQQVSEEYQLWVTPPGLFFSIWAAIFIVKGISNIINLIVNVWTLKAHILLAINNMLLIAWTFTFNQGSQVAVYLSFVVIFAIIPITLLFWTELGKIKVVNWFTYFARNSYAFYLGWIVAATNVGFGILIVYWWGAQKKTQMIIFWVMAPLSAIIITAMNVIRQRTFGLKSCFALWISVIWAFVGAGINTHQCLNGYGENC